MTLEALWSWLSADGPGALVAGTGLVALVLVLILAGVGIVR